MFVPLNDLSRGIAQSTEVQAAILRVLESGRWVHGLEHDHFEVELAEYLGASYVMGVASGTDAIEIALRAIGCRPGSVVVTTANAGGYTSIASELIGCQVLYCDVDPLTLLIDPNHFKTLASKNISAVVVTHLYGNVAPVLQIKEICEEFGIKVIEDCAQAMGARVGESYCGTIGDIGTFSFYPTKNLGAIGDGGAIATNNSVYAEKIRSLRQYGWSSKYVMRDKGGMNSRLDEIQAAVLRLGLRKLDSQNIKRMDILKLYQESLIGSKFKFVSSSNSGNAPHLAVLRLPAVVDRDEFRKMMSEYSVQTDVHYPILDCDQTGRFEASHEVQLPSSRAAVEKIVSIPFFAELTPSEILYVCNTLRNLVKYFEREQ